MTVQILNATTAKRMKIDPYSWDEIAAH